jgi:hypothetical protein
MVLKTWFRNGGKVMSKPVQAILPEDLLAIRKQWCGLDRKKQDELYAEQFAGRFAPLFADLPLHDAPQGMPKPRALISVLGFSWQPVALMAAWCKPERMLVIGTEESLKLAPGGEGVISFIARVAGIARDVIVSVEVGDPGEEDIYRAVRNFMHQANTVPHEVFIDPTGGKKSMSASAALAGFLIGAPLVYVDYGEYDGPKRIPVAGTEYPRLLTNPLNVMGELELRDIFNAFKRSDFQEAERLGKRLAELLYEPREAQCLTSLATAYGAWDRFDFKKALLALQEASNMLARFSTQGKWAWAKSVGGVVRNNIAALEALAKIPEKPQDIENTRPLLAWYLSAAQRFLEAEKPSIAVLLTYAAIERYIDLCLLIDFGLDDDNPDYKKLEDKLDTNKYEEAGRKFHGEKYSPRSLEGKLMFANGAQLLAALAPEHLDMKKDFGSLKGLADARNHCEFEHGFLPKIVSKERVKTYINKAQEIISRIFEGQDNLMKALENYRFPVFGT